MHFISTCGGTGGAGNSTTCNGLCAGLSANEWLANLNYWRAAKTDQQLLRAIDDTELKKSTTQCADNLAEIMLSIICQHCVCSP